MYLDSGPVYIRKWNIFHSEMSVFNLLHFIHVFHNKKRGIHLLYNHITKSVLSSISIPVKPEGQDFLQNFKISSSSFYLGGKIPAGQTCYSMFGQKLTRWSDVRILLFKLCKSIQVVQETRHITV